MENRGGSKTGTDNRSLRVEIANEQVTCAASTAKGNWSVRGKKRGAKEEEEEEGEGRDENVGVMRSAKAETSTAKWFSESTKGVEEAEGGVGDVVGGGGNSTEMVRNWGRIGFPGMITAWSMYSDRGMREAEEVEGADPKRGASTLTRGREGG